MKKSCFLVGYEHKHILLIKDLIKDFVVCLACILANHSIKSKINKRKTLAGVVLLNDEFVYTGYHIHANAIFASF